MSLLVDAAPIVYAAISLRQPYATYYFLLSYSHIIGRHFHFNSHYCINIGHFLPPLATRHQYARSAITLE